VYKKSITALQMDIKIQVVTEKVLKEALKEAQKARYNVLDVMEATIKDPRKN
jgi:polyribonucleotide nucleotidyltransferase